MALHMQSNYLFQIILAIYVPLAAAKFSLPICYKAVQLALSANPSLGLNNTLFSVTPAVPDNPILTPLGCRVLCNGTSDTSIDPECGTRLLQWVFPVVFLVGSMETAAALAWYVRFWSMLRVLGDPVDVLASMVWVLYGYARCDEAAETVASLLKARQGGDAGESKGELRRAFAMVMRAMLDWNPEVELEVLRVYLEGAVLKAEKGGRDHLITLETVVRETAARLRDNHSRPMWKGYGALFIFLLGLVVAMIPQASGTTPSGGMLAAVLIMAPLVLLVLLSNSIGSYTSTYRLHEVLVDFNRQCPAQTGDEAHELALSLRSRQHQEAVMSRADSPLFQPFKFTSATWRRRDIVGICLLCLVFPLGSAAAMLALAAGPAYFNDRIWLLLGIFGTYILGFGATSLTTFLARWQPLREIMGWDDVGKDRWLWRIIAVKDLVLAAFVQSKLAGLTCGWLGTCEVWDAHYRFGQSGARVILNPWWDFWLNSNVLYPGLVATCLGINIVAYFIVRQWWFRSAFAILVDGNGKQKAAMLPEKKLGEISELLIETWVN